MRPNNGRRSPILLVVVCAALLTGCGPKSPLEVDLRTVAITVPRLLTPAIELVPPSAAPQPVRLPPVPPLITVLPVLPTYAPQPPVAPPACPKAGQLDVPAKPASILVPAPPAAGTYVQTAAGSYAGSTATPATGSLAGPVVVEIKALPSATTVAGQKVDSWQVIRTDAARSSTSVEAYQLVHPSTAPGATAGGIYLVGMGWKDPVRGELSFEPTGNPLQILPVPVQVSSSAAQHANSATDPNTLTTLTIIRNVTGRKRIDVCGKLVDTFRVEITGTLTTAEVQWQLSWNQHLATSYGGADVEDTLSLASVTTGFSWVHTVRNTTVPKDVS
ncbi:MAG: hypothetical protein QOE05_122 [Actinomycetota bacterium]|jgi:hypothetical protein|nr:hypothetical protein [Actinomycetota bacterium]